MPERNPDNLKAMKTSADPVIFIHAGSSGAPQKEWLERLLATGMPVFSHGDYAGCRKTANDVGHLGALLKELGQTAPESPVHILNCGLAIDEITLKSVSARSVSDGSPVARSVLSNFTPGYNPFAGLGGKGKEVPIERLGTIVDLLGAGREHRHHEWPGHFLSLSADAVKVLSSRAINSSNALSHLHDAGGSLLVSDRTFALAPDLPLFNDTRLQPHEKARPPSWGGLNARLETWLDTGCPDISTDLAKKKPVTLHVTHSWGGGVALWTSTFISSDKATGHLQLRSEGPQSRQGPGQRLSLYAGDELDCPIASWWLQPPIQSVHYRNDHYRQVLDEICQRFGVGRIIISSLVGHSLDVLRSDIPTVQVLHDHFPVWPFLSANPDAYLDKNGMADFSLALQDKRLKQEFPDRSASSWRTIRDQYLADIRQNGTRLAAPSQSVIDLRKALDPRWKEVEIELIPHGFPPLKAKPPVPVKPRRDERLRLVILGRIQAGKGQKLLLDALPRLQTYAQVYLLGTGKSGEAFFGMPGVNVIVDYRREKLGSLLEEIGPDIAALLSLVPETFSYTLSELHYLGIPAITTRVGSFPGRISEGKNGWLIDPSARELAHIIEQIWNDRSVLQKVRKTLEKQIVNDPKDMVKAYRALCKPRARKYLHAGDTPSLTEVQASALAFQDRSERLARGRAELETKRFEKEVRKRTDWALDTQRELKEEQKRRKNWVGLLEKEVDHLKSEITVQIDQLQEQQEELVVVREEMETVRDEMDTVRGEMNTVQGEMNTVREEMNGVLQELGMTQVELAETRNTLNQKELRLGQVTLDLEQLQALHEQILASSSWRITRPFRVLRRTMQNFMLSRAWNPMRWPLLFSGLARNLRTVGLRGTLMRVQFGGYQEPPPTPVKSLESVGDPDPPSSVPKSRQPLMSVVIPAYNNWVYTAACLRSINEAIGVPRLEVILVDDASSDETEETARSIQGLVYIRNSKNAGFIESCNRGAKKARGKHLVMLNNDTQVMDGWLTALLDVFEMYPEAGLVGSRLVYPDGSLQECGGIVFNDGSGWNYGKGDNPERPEYMHVRDVDYCSGACIMIERELFKELGGFDKRYKPAYYEDTDLAFKVRASGRRVMVQPASTVIHHEGISSGTDTDSGIKRYQVVNQETFTNRWKADLPAFPERIEDPTNPANIRAARDYKLRGRVLIIDATTPEPDQDSGSLRLTHIMRCFTNLGFGVTFFADNHVHAGAYTRKLQQWGVEVIYQPWIESNQAFFRQHGDEFDFVMVSRHYVASNYVAMVRRFCPRARFIFDTVDLHYLREQRLAELEGSQTLRQVANQTRRSELAVIEQSDAVLVVSESEIDVLEEDSPGSLVHVLSNIHDVPGRKQGFDERQDMFFVGGYQHPPNVDAAKWFVNKIWPLIHAELPEASFHLIGSKAPDSVRELKGDGVIFHGFVEDLEHYLDHCRIAVAPLRYGAGVKGKVNMSMSHGQPVVATPMAVEGLHAEHGREVLVAETEQAFADEVIRLYRDKVLWTKISDAAIQNVESHFSVASASRSIEDLIGKLEKP